MFCPGALVYGDVATWLSGAGSFAAVVAALWIAGAQRRDAAKARVKAEADQARHTLEVVTAATAFASDIMKNCDAILKSDERGQDGDALLMVTAWNVYRLHDIDGIRRKVVGLQQTPANDMHVNLEVIRMGYECEPLYTKRIDPRKIDRAEISRIKHDMGQRIDALSNLIPVMSSPQ